MFISPGREGVSLNYLHFHTIVRLKLKLKSGYLTNLDLKIRREGEGRS